MCVAGRKRNGFAVRLPILAHGSTAPPATSMANAKDSRARTATTTLDGCDPDALINFVIVTSDFYAELQAYYEEEAGGWLAQVEAGGAD